MDKKSSAGYRASSPIGTLSKRTGCNIETIRCYEKVGLSPIRHAPKTASGIWDGAPEGGSFIRRARELGFVLDEARALLRLVDERTAHVPSCDVVVVHREDMRTKSPICAP